MKLSKKRTAFAVPAILTTFLIYGCFPNEPLSLRITHLNDTHSHFDEKITKLALPNIDGQPVPTFAYVGGYPRLKTKINQLRVDSESQDKEFVLLHAGDAFSGTLFFTKHKGEKNAEFMNLFQFDAMAIGNHEFDLGNEVLANFADLIKFPLLSANIKVPATDPLHNKYLPFTIKLFDSVPVAIVGLTTSYTEIISSPSDSTEFKDGIIQARKLVNQLEKVGINKIVFITHVGLDEDKALAAAVPGIDVIIGGHSPELLGDHSNIGLIDGGPSPVWVDGSEGDPVCIMHSGESATAIGVTDIEFSNDGLVESCNGQNVFLVGDFFVQGNPPQPVNTGTQNVIASFIEDSLNIEIVTKDEETQAILDQAKLEVEAFASTVVGTTSEPLFHVRLPWEEHPTAGVIAGGSMVASHVAMSMTSKMERTVGEGFVSVINAAGVRSDLSNDITVGDAFTVLPFNSTIVSMKIPGSGIKTMIETNVRNSILISHVAFPYVANIKYTIDITDISNPVVSDILIKDGTGIFQPLENGTIYNLVTTSYLAGGGDLYAFPNATNIVDTGHLDGDVLVEYIKKQPGSVLMKPDNGITVIN